ncbi:hypothetical protein ACH47Z_38055 [Streptomyces sp. NPDC020192]
MKQRVGFYLRVRIEGGGREVVSQARAVLLVETARKSGPAYFKRAQLH